MNFRSRNAMFYHFSNLRIIATEFGGGAGARLIVR
jgi:hypothetical protein